MKTINMTNVTVIHRGSNNYIITGCDEDEKYCTLLVGEAEEAHDKFNIFLACVSTPVTHCSDNKIRAQVSGRIFCLPEFQVAISEEDGDKFKIEEIIVH